MCLLTLSRGVGVLQHQLKLPLGRLLSRGRLQRHSSVGGGAGGAGWRCVCGGGGMGREGAAGQGR
jgi:hypothetical protein